MKITVKQPEGFPIGPSQHRKVLAELTMQRRGDELVHSYELRSTLVEVDARSSLALEASYTPANGVLSIIAGCRMNDEDVQVFSSVTEFGSVPAVFCFRLPGGQYIELYPVDA
jgi:hypothetical protein